MRGQRAVKWGICMENSAVVEHVKLCISTTPAETEKKWRLACSEDKVEQIHTLCRPKNFSITQVCLWKQLYGKFGFNKSLYDRSDAHILGAVAGALPDSLCFFPSWARGCPSACSPGLGSALQVLSQAMGGTGMCRMRCNKYPVTDSWKILHVFVVL